MSIKHHEFWPSGLPHDLTLPATSIFYNAEAAATRFPDKPFIYFYDTPVTFGRFRCEAERLAGFLQRDCSVSAGDRVLLLMQNSPQFVIAYYAIVRANAIVVPINPMSVTEELQHYVQDSGAKTAIVGQEVYGRIEPILGAGLERIVLAAYADYVTEPTTLRLPDAVAAPRQSVADPGVTLWSDALALQRSPGPLTVGPDDLCVVAYSSGATGRPKGCMLTHRNVMHTLVTNCVWFSSHQDVVQLVVLPLFHVTSMQAGMNAPLYQGASIVLMSRWDREVAAELIERRKATVWTAISTMVIDFLGNPRVNDYDLSSLRRVSGGGAAMPAAVGERLQQIVGAPYIEGYGLTETAAPTHLNPIDRPKRQCLGVPVFNTDSRIIDPATLETLPPGEVGEIVIHGPQVFRGYWRNDDATAAAFIELDGKRFFRTGDLGYVDEDGYFFLVDRLKRMINASGFKVWPAEVEAQMYQHPAVQEACVIAARDAHRGETVKAIVVLRAEHKGKVSEADIIEWTRGRMAAYKHPRIVEFVDALPKSATGKVQWRVLQEAERARD
ncbi:MAG TPA: long-chain fatty acid--CoA ligase [Steroidobacter sp.]|nr:long-chain fatty acid--CoA ligase [Steroidobacter sp.]